MQGGGYDPDETGGLLNRATDLAAGMRHPTTAVFHMAFKLAAILTYLFGAAISNNFVNIFVLCILFLAFDFWTVKNVSGRIMVGLRWWSEVRDDGSTEWKFESADTNNATFMDSAVFWVGLFAPALIWFMFGITSVFRLSFDWLLLIVIALALSGANIVGYVRCKKDAAGRIAGGLQGFANRAGVNNVVGRALQSAAGSALGL